MNHWCLALPLVALLGASPTFAAETNPAVRLIVPDGQLRSHPFRVFVTAQLADDMAPALWFRGSHAFTHPTASELRPWPPALVAPRQKWTDTIDGQTVSLDGTLLLFDIHRFDISWYKSAVRVLPILKWQEVGETRTNAWVAVAPQEIYLGNLKGAAVWTLFVVLVVVVLIYLLSLSKVRAALNPKAANTPDKAKEGEKDKPSKHPDAESALLRKAGVLAIFCGSDGYLSLWRAQLVGWTLAIGSLVFCFGLVRLQVPEIPETLVALMGLSIATGGISAAKSSLDATRRDKAATEPRPNPEGPHFFDLISTYNTAYRQTELSIPKAQMVFWTVLVLALFIVKTILDGVLWEVPWQMVALTGISQAGYLGDKFRNRVAK